METLFEQLQRFIATPNCIFDFKPLDYPSALQQHLITSYFQLNTLVKTTSHSDIVRLLHSSAERQLDVFLPGLLYSMLLDFSASHSLFETYMPILRSESWLALDRLLQQLIQESFTIIKNHHKNALIPIFAKLNYFGQLSGELTILAVKAMDSFDLSEHSLNFNNSLLEFFQCLLSQNSESDYLKQILADKFFYKLLRMLTLLNLVDEQSMREYRGRCVSIVYRLFKFSKERCVAMGWAASGIMRELQCDEALSRLLQDCREQLRRSPPLPQNPISASNRLSMVLPIRIEATINFIVKSQISQLEVGVQMGWAFTKAEDHFELILMDILRYILAQPPQDLPSEQGIYLLEWLFYRSCSNNILFQFWKSELFYPCFCEPCPYPAAPERALRFLAYLLQTNFEFGETLLIYLLRQISIPGYAKRLRQLLIEANSLQILDLQMLLNNSRLSARAKSELKAAIGDSSLQQLQKFKEEEAHSYYNPLEEIQRKDSEMEIQFSPSQSSQHFQGYEQQQMSEIRPNEETKGLKIRVEKIFAEDLGESLTILLREPNLSSYKELFRKLMDQIKTFKLNGQVETIELFIVETAKITYLLFQNQFQDHSILFAKDDNVIAYLLTIVSTEWRTNSLIGQCSKKICRKIIDLFATAEPGIWRQFLMYFRRGVVPQVRQIKDWLFPKQKCDYAIPLLRELGPMTKELIDNAEQLKLPLA